MMEGHVDEHLDVREAVQSIRHLEVGVVKHFKLNCNYKGGSLSPSSIRSSIIGLYYKITNVKGLNYRAKI